MTSSDEIKNPSTIRRIVQLAGIALLIGLLTSSVVLAVGSALTNRFFLKESAPWFYGRLLPSQAVLIWVVLGVGRRTFRGWSAPRSQRIVFWTFIAVATLCGLLMIYVLTVITSIPLLGY